MTKFLCIGGQFDGQWLPLSQIRRHRRDYQAMPIRVPHEPKGSMMFKVFHDRALQSADVVMLLLDGYRQGVPNER